MKVIRARELGLCFGVRDAIELARQLPRPGDVTVLGELVHNELVLEELDGRGFLSFPERDSESIPEGDEVLITAHGVSDRRREGLLAAGKKLVDTTCPLVRRAHEAALLLRDEGYHVVVIGKADHVEVLGLTGDLGDFTVVSCPDAVPEIPARRIGVIAQTTTRPVVHEQILASIRERNPGAEIRSIDTICSPTREHQEALEELFRRADVIVAVGGQRSNHTRQLVELALERGLEAHHVQGPGDLNPRWFSPDSVVGLTAGTSTLDETVDAVEDALRALADSAAGAETASLSG